MTTTTIPIFALAIVVESRTISARWELDMPTWIKAVSWLGWAYALAVSCLAEYAGFAILAGQARGTPAWVSIALNAVTVDLTSLLALPLLSSGAQAMARPIAWGVITLYPRMLRARIRQRKMLRTLAKDDGRIRRLQEALDELDGRVVRRGHPGCDECLELTTEIERKRQEVATAAARAQALREDLTSTQAEIMDLVQDSIERLSAVIARGEKGFERSES